MQPSVGPFQDRKQAGHELAAALSAYRNSDTLVMAIPRGGVVVGYEVAMELGMDLDVVVPRKLRAPAQPELAIGAVASWGDSDLIIDDASVKYLGVSQEYIEREAAEQLQEVIRRLVAYRGTAEPPNIAGREVILVDDGVATGYTTRAAGLALSKMGPSKVILAIPVAPLDSLKALRPYVSETVCLKTPYPFLAVGYWYRDFTQVTDEEVVELLRKARERT